MKKNIPIRIWPMTLLPLVLLSCNGPRTVVRINVENPIGEYRTDEMAEVDARELDCVRHMDFRLLGSNGKEVAYQFTSDGKFIFPVTLAPYDKTILKVVKGVPHPVDTLVCGRQYKERDDDFGWENDHAAYRAYGPALQARGERGFGYDIFTKSVSHPVLEHRYALACNPHTQQQISQWRRQGLKSKADSLERSVSYHVDHGNGMDVYGVGPTLGAGTAALMDEKGNLVYPWCYDTFEVTDRGPLRFSFTLKFKPQTVDDDHNVVENRTISLDRGSYLNRTSVRYDGLTEKHRLVAGIVVHPEHPDGYVLDKANRYVAYADSTDNPHAGNGVIYVGLAGKDFEDISYLPYNEDERPQHANALGHAAALAIYEPGTEFTYYWGSGWSKGTMPDMQSWQAWLAHFSRTLQHPLVVKVRK